MTELTADVVICTYTLARWGFLTEAVDSVLTQSATPKRLIIVVDHNDELLDECVRTWGAGSPDAAVEISVVANRFPGRLGSARNTALLLARSDIVAFLDDDAVAETDWLETLLAVYRARPEAVAVGGAARPEYGAPLPSWFPPRFRWVFGCHYESLPEQLAPARHLIGASMSVRRAAMLAVGGFHADDHDDMDLSHRIAHAHGAAAVLYQPRAEVRHHVPAERLTWSYFWHRCFFVNRSKVAAFAGMGDSGNIGAELRFGAGVLIALVPALAAACLGRPERAAQGLAAAAGLVLGGCGYLVGRVRWALGLRPTVLTTGLSAAEIQRAGYA